ncbi:hypothetical protein CIPAW_13G117500 [Carya illinoinensis]|uniref:Uncharacterized protein n=1 Tax=Carya illinoinensis TaxID=32201 RepID=A0A8T1NSJ3_CARIL|nr:hypothetical protein CIPAW_13G117500 [Carya illinoinensis]
MMGAIKALLKHESGKTKFDRETERTHEKIETERLRLEKDNSTAMPINPASKCEKRESEVKARGDTAIEPEKNESRRNFDEVRVGTREGGRARIYKTRRSAIGRAWRCNRTSAFCVTWPPSPRIAPSDPPRVSRSRSRSPLRTFLMTILTLIPYLNFNPLFLTWEVGLS